MSRQAGRRHGARCGVRSVHRGRKSGSSSISRRHGEVRFPPPGALCLRGIRRVITALDARTGKDLWHIQLGAAIYSSPMTYSLDGKQFVVVPAGAALFAFALPGR